LETSLVFLFVRAGDSSTTSNHIKIEKFEHPSDGRHAETQLWTSLMQPPLMLRTTVGNPEPSTSQKE